MLATGGSATAAIRSRRLGRHTALTSSSTSSPPPRACHGRGRPSRTSRFTARPWTASSTSPRLHHARPGERAIAVRHGQRLRPFTPAEGAPRRRRRRAPAEAACCTRCPSRPSRWRMRRPPSRPGRRLSSVVSLMRAEGRRSAWRGRAGSDEASWCWRRSSRPRSGRRREPGRAGTGPALAIRLVDVPAHRGHRVSHRVDVSARGRPSSVSGPPSATRGASCARSRLDAAPAGLRQHGGPGQASSGSKTSRGRPMDRARVNGDASQTYKDGDRG